MNLKTIFKRLVLLDFLLIILVVSSVAFESAEVTDFNKYFENDYSNSLLIVAGILYLVYIVNLFFLYKFKRIGKQIYLILWIILTWNRLNFINFVMNSDHHIFGQK